MARWMSSGPGSRRWRSSLRGSIWAVTDRPLYAKYWDWDLQLLRSLVDPWPEVWPDGLHDLNAAAREAGVEVPPGRRTISHPTSTLFGTKRCSS